MKLIQKLLVHISICATSQRLPNLIKSHSLALKPWRWLWWSLGFKRCGGSYSSIAMHYPLTARTNVFRDKINPLECMLQGVSQIFIHFVNFGKLPGTYRFFVALFLVGPGGGLLDDHDVLELLRDDAYIFCAARASMAGVRVFVGAH